LVSLKRIKRDAYALLWLGILSTISIGLVFFGELFSHTVTATEYVSGYYSPLTRFYEVGFGAIIALIPTNAIAAPRWFTNLGMTLILISAFIPEGGLSWRAVAALGVAGSVLFILGCLSPKRKGDGFLVRGTSLVGDFSYSIYLWHWPIWVTVMSIGLNDIVAIVLSLVLTTVFSVVSNIAFEKPFLRLRGGSGRTIGTRRMQVLVTVPLVFTGVLGFSTVQHPTPLENQGMRDVFGSERILNGNVTERGFADEFRELVKPCGDSPSFTSPNIGKQYYCYQNSNDSVLDILVLGNSHAGHLVPGLATVFPELSFRYYSLSGEVSMENPSMLDAIELIEAHSVTADALLINSFWAIEDSSLSEIQLIGHKLGFKLNEIVIFNDVPDFKVDPVRCKYQDLFLLPSPCSEDLPRFANHLAGFDDEAREKLPGSKMIDSAGFFRKSETKFYLGTEDSVLYRDTNHLNSTGSVELFLHLKSNGVSF
jgi:hypothetical protein